MIYKLLPVDSAWIMVHTHFLGPQDAPLLVMWHGVMRSSRTFAPLWPHLCPTWRLHLIDHRGHGLSPWRDRYLVSDYTADAVASVRQLVQPAVLYGHSLGALVAAGVAAELPHLVRAIILEDPPSPAFLGNPEASSYGAIFRGFQEAARQKGATIAELTALLAALRVVGPTGEVSLGTIRDASSLRLSARMLLELDPETMKPLIAGEWLQGVDFQAVLRRIRCPVLLLQADNTAGGMLSESESQTLRDCLTDVTLARFPGIGHQIHWLATEPLLRSVLAFLESLP